MTVVGRASCQKGFRTASNKLSRPIQDNDQRRQAAGRGGGVVWCGVVRQTAVGQRSQGERAECVGG